MTRRHVSGFVSHELMTAVALLAVLVLIGFGVSELLGLEGGAALLPPGALAGCLLVWVIVVNVAEAIRRRRGAKD